MMKSSRLSFLELLGLQSMTFLNSFFKLFMYRKCGIGSNVYITQFFSSGCYTLFYLTHSIIHIFGIGGIY